MGPKVMTKKKLSFVSFEFKNNHFFASLAIDDFIISTSNQEKLLIKASRIYEYSIKIMLINVSEIQLFRNERKTISARKVWELGDLIFRLTHKFENIALQIDGLYEHLVRDLNVNRKWLEKVITLRRYLPKKTLIPKNMSWGECEKGTRKVAERLLNKTNLG